MYEEDVLEIIEPDNEDMMMMESDQESDQESKEFIENSKMKFIKHTNPIFCISAHPILSNLCATGGGDDLGYIWNTTTNGNPLIKLEGHHDSISFIQFNFNGIYLATASVDGLIKIWYCKDHQTFHDWNFLLDLEGSEEVTWISWHPRGNVIVAGFADGLSTMWTIPTGDTIQVFSGFSALPTCGQFTPDGKTLVIGSEDSRLIIFDPPTAQPIHKLNLREGKYKFSDQNAGISSIAINQSSTLCAIGGLDNGQVRIMNLRTGTILFALDGYHEPGVTVQTAFYEPINQIQGLPLIISVGTDGKIFIFDGSSFKLRTLMQHSGPITTLVVHTKQARLTTGSVDKTLVTWDLRTGNELVGHFGHTDMIHHATLSCDERHLISGSEDGTACVFELPQ
ncbi:hypothetical protein CROQUDRAFT_50058 [Cronartium quercuum f. sp. fusiforme G11]|uniref:Angio-associated migratory cell protein n=1 Tax=Cronartium quercuum f. sp. fusiforme G11 TaxID=708437 RepID=A0A9P6NE72_9BASI|nr:hypothetical protein CROQUDRAFT_50058 [Cronartium quercuum f. sp. fusiforme G11]